MKTHVIQVYLEELLKCGISQVMRLQVQYNFYSNSNGFNDVYFNSCIKLSYHMFTYYNVYILYVSKNHIYIDIIMHAILL